MRDITGSNISVTQAFGGKETRGDSLLPQPCIAFALGLLPFFVSTRDSHKINRLFITG
jgi:hypothetical protein